VVGRSLSPEVTMNKAFAYIIAVRDRFRDEPAKYRQFLSLLRDRRARRYV